MWAEGTLIEFNLVDKIATCDSRGTKYHFKMSSLEKVQFLNWKIIFELIKVFNLAIVSFNTT